MSLPSKEQKKLEGYIKLSVFLDKLDSFKDETGWSVPMGLMDSLHLKFLRFFAKWSWFAERMYIEYSSPFGIGFEQIFNYLKSEIGEIRLIPQKSPIDSIVIYLWRILIKGNTGSFNSLSFGADFNKSKAISKTLGEAVERFFVIVNKGNDIKSFTEDSYLNLIEKGYDVCFPAQYHTFSAEQMKQNPSLYKNDNGVLSWTAGCNYITGKRALIPTQLLSSQVQKLLFAKEGIIHETTTNGAAGWFTKEGAVIKGIFELIQRDAFMVAWLKKKKLPAIDVSTISSPDILNIIEKINTAKAKVQILKAEAVAGVPTAIVIVTDYGFEEEQAYVTAHTDTNFESAVLGALQESLALFGKKEAVDLAADYKPFLTKNIGRIERLNFYKGIDRVGQIQSLHSGEYLTLSEAQENDFKVKSETEIKAEIISRLESLGVGYVPYFYEYKHKLLKKLGFHVVKCFIPQLFSLYLREHLATIKSVRLETCGDTSHEDVISTINTSPHPFP